MKPDIQPIETQYAGCRFRSRLEARWAVFFDALKVRWDYEPEGFDFGEAGWYLPDFWLPQVRMYAEVKPDEGPFDPVASEKCRLLVAGTGRPCLMLNGSPRRVNYWAWDLRTDIDGDYVWDGDGYWVGLQDYIISGYDYHLTENRFFTCTGASEWDQSGDSVVDYCPGVEAARAFRYERYPKNMRRILKNGGVL